MKMVFAKSFDKSTKMGKKPATPDRKMEKRSKVFKKSMKGKANAEEKKRNLKKFEGIAKHLKNSIDSDGNFNNDLVKLKKVNEISNVDSRLQANTVADESIKNSGRSKLEKKNKINTLKKAKVVGKESEAVTKVISSSVEKGKKRKQPLIEKDKPIAVDSAGFVEKKKKNKKEQPVPAEECKTVSTEVDSVKPGNVSSAKKGKNKKKKQPVTAEKIKTESTKVDVVKPKGSKQSDKPKKSKENTDPEVKEQIKLLKALERKKLINLVLNMKGLSVEEINLIQKTRKYPKSPLWKRPYFQWVETDSAYSGKKRRPLLRKVYKLLKSGERLIKRQKALEGKKIQAQSSKVKTAIDKCIQLSMNVETDKNIEEENKEIKEGKKKNKKNKKGKKEN